MTWMFASAGMTSLRECAIPVIPAQAGFQGAEAFTWFARPIWAITHQDFNRLVLQSIHSKF